MKGPAFLSIVEVRAIQTKAIQQFGGTLGIRDTNGLEAAVNHPKNVFFYGNGDLFEIAAAYCFHIAEAQAFLDGNKRALLWAPPWPFSKGMAFPPALTQRRFTSQ